LRLVPAILLLLGFGFSLIPISSFADKQTTLPPCCRRDGKHHCSMSAMAGMSRASSQSSGTALKTSVKCPLFPNWKSVPNPSNEAAVQPSWNQATPVPEGPTAVEQAENRYQGSTGPAWRQRGPPSFSS
jgi:hypothetical protein